MRQFLLVVLIALVVRVGVVVYMNNSPYWQQFIYAADSSIYDYLGRAMLDGQAAYPAPPPGSGAGSMPERIAPLFPYYVAAVYLLLGPGLLQIGLANALLGAITAGFVYLLAARAFSRPAGLLAGFGMAAYPSQLMSTPYFLKETFLVFALVATVVALSLAVDSKRPWLWIALGGAGLALSTLGRYQIIALLPFVALWQLTLRGSLRLRSGLVAVLLAAYFVALIPWFIHTYSSYGTVFIVPESPVSYLRVGNGAGLETETNGYFEGRGLEGGGDPEGRFLVERVTNDPLNYLELLGSKIVNMWRPTWEGSSLPNLIIVGGTYVVMMVLAIPSLLTTWREPRARLLAFVVVYFFLVHMAFYGMIRHRLHVDPYLMAFAGYGAWRVLQTLQGFPVGRDVSVWLTRFSSPRSATVVAITDPSSSSGPLSGR